MRLYLLVTDLMLQTFLICRLLFAFLLLDFSRYFVLISLIRLYISFKKWVRVDIAYSIGLQMEKPKGLAQVVKPLDLVAFSSDLKFESP